MRYACVHASNDEWRVIEALLPAGWRQAAKEQKAFQLARYTTDPASLLRLLLFHAVNVVCDKRSDRRLVSLS